MSGVSAFLWQAALLLLVAYFLGAWIGCFLRRLLTGPPKVAMESDHAGGSRAGAIAGAAGVAGAAAVAGARAQQAASERFSRALDGGETAPRAAPPPPKQVDSIAKLQSASSYQSPPVDQTAKTSLPPEADREAEAAPASEDTSGTASDRQSASDAGSVAAARPLETGDSASSSSPGSAETRREPATSVVPPRPSSDSAATNLTPPMTAATAAAIARAERLAAANSRPPRPADKRQAVPDLPASVGTSGQAVVAAPIARATQAATTTPAPAETTAVTDHDLTLIDGITADDVATLKTAGVKSYGDIANWTAADVKHMSGLIGDKRRIARQNWIEQAQMLHDGKATAFSRKTGVKMAPRPAAVATDSRGAPNAARREQTRAAQSTHGAVVAPPIETPASQSAGESAALAAAAAVAASAVAAASTSADRATVEATSSDVISAEPAAIPTGSPSSASIVREDLQQIDGINAEVAKLLHQQGVTRISQIANWSPEEQHRVDRLLGGMNRVSREDWVRQARQLSGYRDAEAKTTVTPVAVEPPAAPPTVSEAPVVAETAPTNVVALNQSAGKSVRGLRSVRSEALAGNTAPTDRPDAGHDLKRIRGIGVLLEKRLRALGYTSYEQISAWSQSDIDKISQKLDITGRIQRENWIEQARILANGGQTEFSRRIDRHES